MAKVDAYYISELIKELKQINNKKLSQSDKDGDIGEKFVKYGLKYYFWSRGFKIRKKGKRTFNMEGQIRGKGGIDFRTEVRHNKFYNCYIEVKNWKIYYSIPNSMFNKQILNRFTRNANQPGCIWTVTMNKNNIHLIQKRCQHNNILIVPMDRKITANQLNVNALTPMMENFLDDLSKLFNTITGKNIGVVKRKSKINKPGTLEWDLEIGIPYKLLAVKYNKSVGTLGKRYHKLGKIVKDLPDRRRQEWRGMQFLPVKKLDKYMLPTLNLIREKEGK